MSVLNVSHGLSVSWNFEGVPPAIGSLGNSGKVTAALALAQGTGNLQANEPYVAQGVLTVGSPMTLINLYGVLQDVFKTTLNFTAIKFFFIQNNGTPNGNGGFDLNSDAILLVGGAGAAGHAWDDPFNGNQDCQLKVGAGDHWCATNRLTGFSVANNSANILKLQHSGTEAITWTLVLAGVM
jgi:hypothetical protein